MPTKGAETKKAKCLTRSLPPLAYGASDLAKPEGWSNMVLGSAVSTACVEVLSRHSRSKEFQAINR